MKAVVLSAGRGERLQPITDTRPKSLVPVLCKPLIEWELRALEKTNLVDEVFIVVSYMRDELVKHVSSLNLNLKVKFVDQGAELGTGDAVIKSLSAFGDYDDYALIVYGDIFLSNWSVLERVASAEGNVVAATRKVNCRDYGVLVVDGSSLRGVVEKPERPVSGLVNTGIYKLRVRDIVENKEIELSPRGEYEFTDILNNIAKSRGVRVLDISGVEWIDIGVPWNLIEANKIALNEMKNSSVEGLVESGVVVRGPVHIGRDSIVRSNTYIEGPAYFDRNVEVGPSARIRPFTVVCEGSRIGFSVEVKESVIMEGVHVSHLSYIGDSVVCEHANLGAGTITANLRFDNKTVKVTVKGERVDSGRRKLGAIIGGHVKTGVHVSIMPGVKIGSHSWIGPGAVVTRDVPSRTFLRAETNYLLEKLPLDYN